MCLSVMYPSLIAMFTFDWMDLRGVCDGVTCNMGVCRLQERGEGGHILKVTLYSSE